MEGLIKLFDWLLNKINFYILLPIIIIILLILLFLPIVSIDIYNMLGWNFLLDKKGYISLILLICIIALLVKGFYDIILFIISKKKEKNLINEIIKNERMKLILMDLYNSRPDANLLNTDDEDVVYLLAYKLIFHSGGKGWPANSTFTSYKYPMLLTVKGKRIVEDKL